MTDRIYGHMLVLDPDSDLIAEVPGLKLPTVEAHTYILVDDDAKECRVISEDELEASYVDNNIHTFQLQEVNLLTLDVDNQYVTITYSSGAQTSLLLGSIDLGGGGLVEQYAKRNGVIYAIDDAGHVQLDATNTPNLVYVRKWYLGEAKRVNDERIEIAELVHDFAEAIGELGHAGHLGQEMKGD
ncbi:MAG: hypothetical protein WCF84_08410 [Anaerolineae bacterium]